MPPKRRGNLDNLARQVCLRCRCQKRKCDKTFPQCSLCKRLKTQCVYETPVLTASSSTPPAPAEQPLAATTEQRRTTMPKENDFVLAIVECLSGSGTIEDVAGLFFRSVHPWFPIIDFDTLCRRLPGQWEHCSPEFSLLLAGMKLLTTIPGRQCQQNNAIWAELKELHTLCKAFMGMIDAQGCVSLDVIQARTFLLLFEVGHGLYPAGYITMGTLSRSSDALGLYSEAGIAALRLQTEEEFLEESHQTRVGILILFRYVALENVHQIAANGESTIPFVSSEIIARPNIGNPKPDGFAHLYEASGMLAKVLKLITERNPQIQFPTKELEAGSRTIIPPNNIVEAEANLGEFKLYCTGWMVCNSALLLFGTDTKNIMSDVENDLDSQLEELADFFRPTVEGRPIEQLMLPPFVTYLLFKAASIFTERIKKGDNSTASMDKLRIFRDMLRMVNDRWRVAGRYLAMLDEDTTLRMAKALEYS
ncbi:hypothetical protein BJ875DRAFT_81705 [Amylocarpus encephaloides]|uniref:Zn(2)-C6 fungal-type domain-containing protein n=1 Tax=Amylocarpus encephaloides TaxID=45428 RepID=A0A9P7YEG6_9HELO|nr:hypothetical protein BJ875DRAFT_81705 [Amylocarpus encephaloides]